MPSVIARLRYVVGNLVEWVRPRSVVAVSNLAMVTLLVMPLENTFHGNFPAWLGCLWKFVFALPVTPKQVVNTAMLSVTAKSFPVTGR